MKAINVNRFRHKFFTWWPFGQIIWQKSLIGKIYCLFSLLLATCWSGASPAEPDPGCHEPPVQHPGGSESGQLVAGEEPAATDPHPCPDTLSPAGPAEGQLQPRVSHSRLLLSTFQVIFKKCALACLHMRT